jgi:hypothetical protein
MPMKPNELAQMILLTLNVFDFLQFVDELFESGDPQAQALIDRYFAHRFDAAPGAMNAAVPFANLYTALPILKIVIFFASSITQDEWNETQFSIQPEHKIRYRSRNQDTVPTLTDVIRTIRNAIAHLPDFIAEAHTETPNVSFETGVVSFRSRRPESSVEFMEKDGFRLFLNGFLRSIRRLVKKKLLPSGTTL